MNYEKVFYVQTYINKISEVSNNNIELFRKKGGDCMGRIIKILTALIVVIAAIFVIYDRKVEQEVTNILNNDNDWE